jgi:hypothetical protein
MRPTARIEAHAIASTVSKLVELAGAHGSESLQRVLAMAEMALGLRPVPEHHPQQRPSLFYMPGLESPGWHDPTSKSLKEVARVLEQAYGDIRKEASTLLEISDDHWQLYAEAYPPANPLTGQEGWHVSPLVGGDSDLMRQRLQICPKTSAALAEVAQYRTESEVMFSLLEPGTELFRHCGEANFRLIMHLPLVVPEHCAIEVGGEARTPQEGKCLVFDDTFVHTAWNRSDKPRVHLILTLWHPDVTPVERLACTALSTGLSRLKDEPSLEEELIRLIVNRRIFKLGAAPATREEVGADAVERSVKEVETAAQQMLKNPIGTRVKVFKEMRRVGLFPSLEWTAPGVFKEPVRDPNSFALLWGKNAEGTIEASIEGADVELSVSEEWLPFLEYVLSGGPFVASEARGRAPDGAGEPLVLAYLTALRNEGLLIPLGPQS